MSTYPTTVDNATSLPYPTATSPRNNPSLAALNGSQNDALIALETKLGTGNSTPTANTFLTGNGVGASAWANTVPAGTVVGTTDTQTLTNKTLTAPTITNATISTNTVTGYAVSNTGTVFGVPISTGVIQTANTVNGAALTAASIPTAALTNGSVTPDKLSASSQTAQVDTSETTTSTTYADLTTTTDTVTVTIGANGIALLLISSRLLNSGANASIVSFVASGANTIAAADNAAIINGSGGDNTETYHKLLTGLNSGTTTFKMKYRVAGGTGTFINRRITVIPL